MLEHLESSPCGIRKSSCDCWWGQPVPQEGREAGSKADPDKLRLSLNPPGVPATHCPGKGRRGGEYGAGNVWPLRVTSLSVLLSVWRDDGRKEGEELYMPRQSASAITSLPTPLVPSRNSHLEMGTNLRALASSLRPLECRGDH